MSSSRRSRGTVKLTKSSSSDPQDTGLEPVANPPCWGSETAVSLNLTIPSADIADYNAYVLTPCEWGRSRQSTSCHDRARPGVHAGGGGALRGVDDHPGPVSHHQHSLRQRAVTTVNTGTCTDSTGSRRRPSIHTRPSRIGTRTVRRQREGGRIGVAWPWPVYPCGRAGTA